MYQLWLEALDTLLYAYDYETWRAIGNVGSKMKRARVWRTFSRKTAEALVLNPADSMTMLRVMCRFAMTGEEYLAWRDVALAGAFVSET